jgi:2-keto-4-pentenoate hydratase
VSSSALSIAREFVTARTNASHRLTWLEGFRPTVLDAYDVQRLATELHSDSVAAWKVGRLHAPHCGPGLTTRFIGPVFAKTVRRQLGSIMRLPIRRNVNNAVEAELLVLLKDLPDLKSSLAHDYAWQDHISAIHVGVELAGNDLGKTHDSIPFANVAAFGNNRGLIIGDRVPHELYGLPLHVRTMIDSHQVGAAEIVPWAIVTASLSDAIAEARALNFELKPGQWIATGALTGIHAISACQNVVIQFEGYESLELITSDIEDLTA